MTGGGENLGGFTYDDGSSADISSGGLFQFGGGIQIKGSNVPVEGQLTINYHFDQINASNGKYKWSRTPIEALAFYRLGKGLKLGGGARFSKAKLYASLNSSSKGVSSKSTVGLILEGDYCFTQSYKKADGLCVGLRYVNEEYDFGGSRKMDGSHGGIKLSYSF